MNTHASLSFCLYPAAHKELNQSDRCTLQPHSNDLHDEHEKWKTGKKIPQQRNQIMSICLTWGKSASAIILLQWNQQKKIYIFFFQNHSFQQSRRLLFIEYGLVLLLLKRDEGQCEHEIGKCAQKKTCIFSHCFNTRVIRLPIKCKCGKQAFLFLFHRLHIFECNFFFFFKQSQRFIIMLW